MAAPTDSARGISWLSSMNTGTYAGGRISWEWEPRDYAKSSHVHGSHVQYTTAVKMEPVDPPVTDDHGGDPASEKHEDTVRINGTSIKLKECSVRIRRLTPEEIMLHTRKSSRKRKGSEISPNKAQINKKFRRIVVVSDNSDEESEGRDRPSTGGYNSPSISSDIKCDKAKMTKGQGKYSEAGHHLSKGGKDSGLNNNGMRSGSKHVVKKSAIKPIEVIPLFEPDLIGVVSPNVDDNLLENRTKNIGSDQERLKLASRGSSEKVADRNSAKKFRGGSLPLGNKSATLGETVSAKVGNRVNAPSVANSINRQHRHLPLHDSDKVCLKGGIKSKSSLLNKTDMTTNQLNKSLEKPQRDLSVGSSQITNLKNSITHSSKHHHDGTVKENVNVFVSPNRVVGNAQSLTGKGDSKEILRSKCNSASKESLLVKSYEKQASVTSNEHDVKAQCVRRQLKTKVGPSTASSKQHTSEVRPGHNSSVPNIRSGPKEMGTSSSDIVSREKHSSSNKERLKSETVGIPSKEVNCMGKFAGRSEKSKDELLSSVEKHKHCPSPFRPAGSSPRSTERSGSKEALNDNGGIVSNENRIAPCKEKEESVTMSSKEVNFSEKSAKTKDGLTTSVEKYKHCPSPFRPGSSLRSSERLGSKDVLNDKGDILSNETQIPPSKEKSESVTIPSKEVNLTGKFVGKVERHKDGLVTPASKHKHCPSPYRPAGSSPRSSERSGSKEALNNNGGIVSNEKQIALSKEYGESVTIPSKEVNLTGKSAKTKDGLITSVEKHKHCPSPYRPAGNSPRSSETSGSKEALNNNGGIVSNEKQIALSKEYGESVTIPSKEVNLTGKSAKTKDGLITSVEKHKHCPSPYRPAGSSPRPSERSGSKEALNDNGGIVSNEKQIALSKEYGESVTIPGKEVNLTGKSAKTKDGLITSVEKHKHCPSPFRPEGSSPRSSERSGSKEVLNDNGGIVSNENRISISKEKEESVTIPGKEVNLTGKGAKTKDGLTTSVEKHNHCPSPFRPGSSPRSSERSGSKEVLNDNGGTLSNETQKFPSKEKRESVTIPGKEVHLTGKFVGKGERNRDGLVTPAAKHKHCPSPFRPTGSSPRSTERSGSKEVLNDNSGIVSYEKQIAPSKEKSESVTVPSKEMNLTEKFVGKGERHRDGLATSAAKHKHCPSPYRPAGSSPRSTERSSSKDVVKSSNDIGSNEAPIAPSGEKAQSESFAIKELDVKSEFGGKVVKSKEGHLIGSDRYRESASPVRSRNSPASSDRLSAKEMVDSNSGVSNEMHSTPSKEMSHISKESCIEKTSTSKKSCGPSDAAKQFAGLVRVVDNTTSLKDIPGPKDTSTSDHASTEKQRPESVLVGDKELHSNGKGIINSSETRDGISVSEGSRQLAIPGEAIQSRPQSTEKGISELKSTPKLTEKPQRELVPANIHEHKLKRKHVSQNNKSKDEPFGHDRTKTVLPSPVQAIGNIPSYGYSGSKEILASNLNQDSKVTNSTKDMEKVDEDIGLGTNVEMDLRKKNLLKGESEEGHKTVENDTPAEGPVGKVVITPASSEIIGPKGTFGSKISDVLPEEPIIGHKNMSKRYQANTDKSQHVSESETHASSSPFQGKPQQEAVSSTGTDQEDTVICHKAVEKSKSTIEKSSHASKVVKGSRRPSKTIRRLSSEVEVSTTKHEKTSGGKLAVPEIRSSGIHANKVSQQGTEISRESIKAPYTSDKDLILLTSSVIEKCSGSYAGKIKSPSAIEADSIDQLMQEYETLTSNESSKTSGEKKTDRRRNQRKILNIFGEDHLDEDTQSMLKTPLSFQVAENSGAITSILNADDVGRALNIEDLEGVSRKRKISGSLVKKRGRKYRRHSVDVSSVNVMPGKKSLIKGRASVDSAGSGSCIGVAPQMLSSSTTSLIGISQSVKDLDVDTNSGKGMALISSCGTSSQERELPADEISNIDNGVGGQCPIKDLKKETPWDVETEGHLYPASSVESVGQGKEAAKCMDAINEDPDIMVLEIKCPLIGEDQRDTDRVSAPTTLPTSSTQCVGTLVSSSKPLAMQGNPEVDSSIDSLGIGTSEPQIVPEVEGDISLNLEELVGDGAIKDLLCSNRNDWRGFSLDDKLKLMQDVCNRREMEMNKAKAAKEKVLRLWEKDSGIEFVEIGVSKKEVTVEGNQPASPLMPKLQNVTSVEVKEEMDAVSTVSTEIFESNDDLQSQQREDGEVGSSQNAELVSSSGPSAEGSVCRQDDAAVTGALESCVGNSAVSSSASDRSVAIPQNSSRFSLDTAAGIADSGGNLDNMQVVQLPALATTEAAESVLGPETSNMEMGNEASRINENAPVPRETRLRVRGLKDLLAVPSQDLLAVPSQNLLAVPSQDLLAVPSHQQHSQDNIVVASSSETVNDPDKDIRDSFKNEAAFVDFKELQSILAEIGKVYMQVIGSTNPEIQTVSKKYLEYLYHTNAVHVCELCSKVIGHFKYSDPKCFASFLYFQVSFAMKSHNGSFTLESLKKLVFCVFRISLNKWNLASHPEVSKYFAKILVRMGMCESSILNSPQPQPPVQKSSDVVSPGASVQSLTLSNVVLHNQSSSSSSRDPSSHICPTPHVPLNQNMPRDVLPSRNHQVQNHVANVNDGIQAGGMRRRPDISTLSESSPILGQNEVNRGPISFQAESAVSVRSVPNMSVNPNPAQRNNLPFVPVKHVPVTQSQLAQLLVGESVNVNQNKSVGGQMNQSRVTGGQLNVHQSSALISQSPAPIQTLMNFSQAFQHNAGNQVPIDQRASAVNIASNAPNMQQNIQQSHFNVPFNTQQTTAVPNQQSGNAASVQSPRSNPQNYSSSHSVQFMNTQNSVQSQPLQRDSQTYYAMHGTSVASQAYAQISVERNVAQATPSQPAQPMYQSSANTNDRPPPPYNRSRSLMVSQGQGLVGDNVVPGNAQSNHVLPQPYFPSVSHSGNIPVPTPYVGVAQERVNVQSVVQGAGQVSTIPNSRAEAVTRKRLSADGMLRWRQQQQQHVPQSQSYANAPMIQVTNQSGANHILIQTNVMPGNVTGVNPNLMQTNMVSSMPRVVSQQIHSQVSNVQHSRQGHQSEARPSIIHTLPRRGIGGQVEQHNLTVLNAAPQQTSSLGITIQSSASYAVQQHSGGSMRLGPSGYSSGPGTYTEQVVTASKQQSIMPAVTSPVHGSSPASLMEENDQGRGQGLCRPISNDSGYRSPSQGFENGGTVGNNIGHVGVCYSCHQGALLTCSKCQSIYYCSVECQTKDWGRHKLECSAPVSQNC